MVCDTHLLSPLLQSIKGLVTGGGGYFLIRGKWGCATGWGRIFTTGLTIMGSPFSEFWGQFFIFMVSKQSYQNICTLGEKQSVLYSIYILESD